MSNFFRLVAVAAVLTSAAIPTLAQQTTQTQVLSAAVIGTPSGMWVVSAAQRASFCVAGLYASGSPNSKCAVIGTLSAAPAGYFFSLQGSNLMAINRSNGDIFSCTFGLQGGITPQGNCAAISNLAALN